MRCPVRRCQSIVRRVRSVKTTTEGVEQVQKYSDLNLDRRRYECLRCRTRFFSVEILESLFDELRVGSRIVDVGEIDQHIRKSAI